MDVVFDAYQVVAIGFATTVLLALFAGVGSLVFGTVLVAMRVGPVAVMRRAAAVYVTVVRNTPLLLVLLFLSIAAPKIGINFRFVDIVVETGWGNVRMTNAFAGAVVGLTLYTSCFVCEALRSGVNAVAAGPGRGRAGDRPAVRRRDAPRRPAPGVPGRAAAAGQHPHRPAQEHHGRDQRPGARGGLRAEAAARRQPGVDRWSDPRDPSPRVFVVLVEVVSFGSNRLERRWRVAAR